MATNYIGRTIPTSSYTERQSIGILYSYLLDRAGNYILDRAGNYIIVKDPNGDILVGNTEYTTRPII